MRLSITDIKYHHIRDVTVEGLIDLEYCGSDSNISDVLMKYLSKNSHIKLVEALGFINLWIYVYFLFKIMCWGVVLWYSILIQPCLQHHYFFLYYEF